MIYGGLFQFDFRSLTRARPRFRTRSRSAAGGCFEPLGVARALDRDRGRGAFDLGEVVPRQFDIHRAEVLLKPVELCGIWDRHDPRLLTEQPRDRDLRGSRVLLFRDFAEQVDQRLIAAGAVLLMDAFARTSSGLRRNGSRSRRRCCGPPCRSKGVRSPRFSDSSPRRRWRVRSFPCPPPR
jgi:hypothetical protein